MIRGAGSLLQALQQGQAACAVRGLSTAPYIFSSPADAPPPAGSTAVAVAIKADAKQSAVEVKAGGASAKATYPTASVRQLQDSVTALYETPRISVLHASFQEHLLRLAHERYQVLASWPDFSKMFGKDYYYRAHPADVARFNALVDEFHRMWDVVTEFDSLAHLANHLVPGYKKKRHNVLGPAVGPTLADGVLVQFLLAKGQ